MRKVGILLAAFALGTAGCGNECRYFEQCAKDATLLQCGGGVDQMFGRKPSEVDCAVAVSATATCVETDAGASCLEAGS